MNAVTTICEGLRGDILGRGIPPEKVTVIPNAVNIENFSMAGIRDVQLATTLGLNENVVLGFIGSFYAYEGLAVLIQALPKMLAGNPKIRVLLVGGGPQEQELKALAARFGVENKVIFTGRVPHDQVQAYYNLIDILVYPRLKMRLTDLVTPLKPLEAMAQGRLVVASDVGGHQELIQDGKTGMLFAADDRMHWRRKCYNFFQLKNYGPACGLKHAASLKNSAAGPSALRTTAAFMAGWFQSLFHHESLELVHRTCRTVASTFGRNGKPDVAIGQIAPRRKYCRRTDPGQSSLSP